MGAEFLSLALLSVVFLFLARPELAYQAATSILRLLAVFFEFFRKHYTSTKVASDINRFLDKSLYSQLDEDDEVRVKVRWVDDAKDPVFGRDGSLIVRLKKEGSDERNSLLAAASTIPKAFHPLARPYLKANFREAVDLQILRRFAEELGARAQKVFATDILAPSVRGQPQLQDLIAELNAVDKGGLFTAVLLQELIYLGERAQLDPPDATVHREITDFVEWLEHFATREPHDESVDLAFIREHIRVALILLSKSATAVQGYYPYTRRLGLNLARGADSVYLLGVTEEEQEFCDGLVKEIRGDPRVRIEKQIQIVNRHGQRESHLPLVLFGRNLLYLPRRPFGAFLEEGEVEVGTVLEGRVVEIFKNKAALEIGGIPALLRSRNWAWGYKGSMPDRVTKGDHLKVVVVEINHERSELEVSRKHLEPPPWEEGAVPKLGEELEVEVREVVPSGIVVIVSAYDMFGRIPNDAWTWREEEGGTYVPPEEGMRVTAIVDNVQPDHDDVVLSRKHAEELDEDAWATVAEKYPKGSRVQVTVQAKDHAGIVCELEPGIIGRISDHELRAAGFEFAKWKESVVPGQGLDAVVKNIKYRKRRFVLHLARNLGEGT